MMIHEKLFPAQFLLDPKNELHHHTAQPLHPTSTHHLLHHPPAYPIHQHHSHSHHQQPSVSPPISALKMGLYSAYAYQQQQVQQQRQQQQQQQQLGVGDLPQHHIHQSSYSPAAEVLDLSRRSDSVETTPSRKTPSPYQTNSSFGANSPPTSPADSLLQKQQQQEQRLMQIPANLLYSTQAQQNLPATQFSTIYPPLYFPVTKVKEEPVDPSAPCIQPTQHLSAAAVAATNLLQTFASAAAVAASSASSSVVSNKSYDDEEINVLHCTPTPTPAAVNDSTKTTTTTTTTTPTSANINAQRPFKTYARDPLVVAANFAAADVLLDNPHGVERYSEYRKRVLEQIRSSNGGSRTVTNPKMRRTNSGSACSATSSSTSNNNSESEERVAAAAAATAEESSDCDSNVGSFDKTISSGADNISCSSGQKDAAYYERRRKNNAAAKKSRDRRRIKEDEIAIRATYLERQNIELLCQIDSLKAQLAAYSAAAAAKLGA